MYTHHIIKAVKSELKEAEHKLAVLAEAYNESDQFKNTPYRTITEAIADEYDQLNSQCLQAKTFILTMQSTLNN